jgi:hypothetical protein
MRLPESWKLRLVPTTMGYRASEVPPPVAVPDEPIRLLIAPANYAGQGFEWARAAERLPGVGARNLTITRPGSPDFASDASVSETVAVRSAGWIRRQVEAVERFTHVLYEAERPMLGGLVGGDIRREVEQLAGAGLRIGFVSHGSDLRLPSRHAELDPWSPFRDADWDLLPVLEQVASQNSAFLREQDGPVFVSTPELIIDHPGAVWLPAVVDPERWRADRPPLGGGRPVVLHAPTNEVIKGSLLIEPHVTPLHDRGAIEYRRLRGVAASEMPAAIAASDIVLEQFRLGIYSVAAVEAMAAGRIVVGHVSPQVRAHVRSVSGIDVPIVQATPDTIEDVLLAIIADPHSYGELAARGPSFVRAVHDGALSAEVLAPFLGAEPARRDQETAHP